MSRPTYRPADATGPAAARPRRARLSPLTAAVLAVALLPALAGLAPAPLAAVATPPAAEDAGGLFVRDAGGGRTPLPLLASRYRVDVTGVVARGTVRQTYRNVTSRTIEAIYAFPLAAGAAVDDLELRIGTRRIVGVVRETERARAEYEQAKREGRKAALLERRCEGCFRIAVSAIAPGDEIEVVIRWRQEADYDGGTFRLAVPLTATPRYEPASGAAAGASDGPGFVYADARSRLVQHASLAISIDAGVDLDLVASPTHEVELGFEGRRWLVETAGDRMLADREFVLEWTLVSGRHPAAAVFLDDDAGGDADGWRHGLVTLVPPDEAFDAPALPARTLFVIDVSGSMAGPSIRQARAALLAAIERLGPADWFNVLAFNHDQALLAPAFLPADGAGRDLGRGFARGLGAGGGTEIYAALGLAIETLAADPGQAGEVRRLVFLTDGAVGDRDGRLAALVGRLGDARLHVVGLGHAPNRPLLRRMSALGRGLSEFVAPNETTENRIDAFFARLDRPVLADVRLELDGAPPEGMLPNPLPDLHAGEPLVASFRIADGTAPTTATLRARGPAGELALDVPLISAGGAHVVDAGLGARWGARRVRALLDALALGANEEEIRPAVVEIARRFRLVTPYTSLVAVESVPSAPGGSEPLRLALSRPPGGTLPQGGTAGPLAGVAGSLLLIAGALLLLRPGRRRRVAT